MSPHPSQSRESGPPRPTVQLLTVGDELLAGDTVDGNKAFLARQCRAWGLEVRCAVTVRDRVDEIAAAITQAIGADVCLVSGGLGPTRDDLTAAAIAKAAGVPLRLDPDALEVLEGKFRALGVAMAPSNRKQAELPEGGEWLPNPIGSAAGFTIGIGRSRVFAMPGVPRELQKMMTEQVEPRLAARWKLWPRPRRIYRMLGRGESSLARDAEPVIEQLQDRAPGLLVHYRASYPDVSLMLEAAPGPDGAIVDIDTLAMFDEPLQRALAPALYGIGEADLPRRLVAAMTRKGISFATAESCTAGSTAAAIGGVAGASACLLGGIVAYANQVKVDRLGVPPELLARDGAVSESVARAMAQGARRATGADLAVGITGIAGPSGGTPEKPVGTVDFAVADESGEVHKRLRLRGNRGAVQRAATRWALKLSWDRLAARGDATVEVLD